jgi:hypothetical protein
VFPKPFPFATALHMFSTLHVQVSLN